MRRLCSPTIITSGVELAEKREIIVALDLSGR